MVSNIFLRIARLSPAFFMITAMAGCGHKIEPPKLSLRQEAWQNHVRYSNPQDSAKWAKKLGLHASQIQAQRDLHADLTYSNNVIQAYCDAPSYKPSSLFHPMLCGWANKKYICSPTIKTGTPAGCRYRPGGKT